MGNLSFIQLVTGSLGVWRITHLLNAEDGPAALFAKLRSQLGASMLGETLDCFYCLSIWIAAPIAYWLIEPWSARVLLWLALSAGACLLERASAARIPAVNYYEEKGEHKS